MKREEIIEFLKNRKDKKNPSISELASEMNIDAKELSSFIALIDNMENSGDLIVSKKGRLCFPEDMGYLTGKIQIHPKGFAFLIRKEEKDQKGRNDVFIPPSSKLNAMNGDTVMVKLFDGVTPSDEKLEGEVVKILNRNTTTVIGTFQESQNFGFVVPDDKRLTDDIFIQKNNTLNARNNDVVVVEITKYSSMDKSTEGKIISVLGQKGEPGVDMKAIFERYNLVKEFPEEVMKYVNDIPEIITEEEIGRRRDLREELIVTIDGADAKDLDDAVTVKKLENGNYKLGVHIADVTHYVKENSVLDREALRRATSVYLIDTVVPMLPQKLSNNLCSLNPQTDKLTLSCEMEIDTNGKVKDYDVFESVIRTTERMTYDNVTRILEGNDEEINEKYRNLIPMFKEMEELFDILNKRRMNRGAIDFDFTESVITLNEKGEPITVEPFYRGVSNRIIEEFMLVANETIAEHMYYTKMPFVYRIHEEPDPEKLEAFAQFATNMGLPLRIGREVEPKDLQKIIETVKGTDEEQVLSKLLLRSMMQAKYSPNNLGHFGLAAQFYCHFTSPIRRYPDLQIHRIIKHFINGRMDDKAIQRYQGIVEVASEISSDMERVAQDAEREVEDLKKAQYMHAHLGEEFDGVISSVTNFGFFVELPNTIEGLVRINTLPANYFFDERRMIIADDAGSDIFRLGDSVRVIVSSVDVDLREINFDLLGRIDRKGTYEERATRESILDRPLVVGNFNTKKSKSGSYGRRDSKRDGHGKSGFSRSGSKKKSKGGSKEGSKFIPTKSSKNKKSKKKR